MDTAANPSPDPVRAASDALMRAHQHLVPEHQALVKEEAGASGDRRGTVRRMRLELEQTAAILAATLDQLALMYGVRALGHHEGLARCPQAFRSRSVPAAGELLAEAMHYLGGAVHGLSKTYSATRKHPGLAVARRPEQMREVLAGLRDALTATGAALEAQREVADSGQINGCLSALEELEGRVCQGKQSRQAAPPLMAGIVRAAILRDPAVARAATAALREAGEKV